MYEIRDPAYVDMFRSLGGITGIYSKNLDIFISNLIRGKGKGGGITGKSARVLGWASRIFPNLITHSPPFVVWNGIRDTHSGSINSAFGFNALGFFPGLSTAKGLYKTFKPLPEMFKGLGNVLNPKHPN